jgi:hypothetical protein
VAFDADSVQTREPESTNDQRRDLEERWNRMLGSVQLHLAQNRADLSATCTIGS